MRDAANTYHRVTIDSVLPGLLGPGEDAALLAHQLGTLDPLRRAALACDDVVRRANDEHARWGAASPPTDPAHAGDLAEAGRLCRVLELAADVARHLAHGVIDQFEAHAATPAPAPAPVKEP